MSSDSWWLWFRFSVLVLVVVGSPCWSSNEGTFEFTLLGCTSGVLSAGVPVDLGEKRRQMLDSIGVSIDSLSSRLRAEKSDSPAFLVEKGLEILRSVSGSKQVTQMAKQAFPGAYLMSLWTELTELMERANGSSFQNGFMAVADPQRIVYITELFEVGDGRYKYLIVFADGAGYVTKNESPLPRTAWANNRTTKWSVPVAALHPLN